MRVATLTMPGDRSVTEPRRATPAWIEVEQKEPAAAAQLQRPVVGQVAQLLVGHRRVEQIAGVVDAALVVGDRPLVVVRLGLPVVVQHLGELGVVAGRLYLFRGRVRVWDRSRGVGDIRDSVGFLRAHNRAA